MAMATAMEAFKFGPYKIDRSEVFFSTPLSYAMVNLRPLLPDVLVCPRREVKRFVELTADETSDLWRTAKEVGGKLERYHEASSLTFAIQRWRLDRVWCFRREEKNPPLIGEEGSDLFELLPKELENNKLDKSSEDNGNWILHLQKVKNRVFTLQTESWTVPWTAETIIQVMLLWIASFWFVGSWIIPFLAHIAGFSKQSLTYRSQALYSLITDIAAGLAGITILHRCLSRFRPLPSGWFHFSLKGTWYFDVILGCFLFPVVNLLTSININMVPVLPSPSLGVSSVEQSIVARDPVAMALYAMVVAVCAPVWEEILFRGFLLPSLTRYMSLPWSIVVSSVGFAFAHFNVQRVLPLVLLGMVKGIVFARSRNLLASMLVHSLWNGYVFLDLMK